MLDQSSPLVLHVRRCLLASLGCLGCAVIVWLGLARTHPATHVESLAALSQTEGTSSSASLAVTHGTFIKTVRLNGIVEATRLVAIRVPQVAGTVRQQLVVTGLVPKGASVRKGDVVVEFDPQNYAQAARDRRDEWLGLEEQIRKRRGELLVQQTKDETELATAKNAVALARLEIQKNELLPRVEAQKNELHLEDAEGTLAQLSETFAFTRIAAQAEVKILDVRRDRAALAMREAEENIKRMAVRSPIDGVVVYRNFWRDGQRSDPVEGLTMWPGAGILDVVSTNDLRVRVRVNQADINQLRAGERATIRLDAYPDRTYDATLEHLAPIGLPGTFSSTIRTFSATFAIHRPDAMAMPNLWAAVDVEVERLENVLIAPREAVEFRQGQAFLHVRGRAGTKITPIAISAISDLQVVVTSGAAAGMAVDAVASQTPLTARRGGL